MGRYEYLMRNAFCNLLTKQLQYELISPSMIFENVMSIEYKKAVFYEYKTLYLKCHKYCSFAINASID